MANIEKVNSRQKAVNQDLTLDRELTILINHMSQWISENSQHGTTANRPTKNLYIGRRYRDDTLGYWIHVHSVNPTVWHNGAGAIV